MANYDDAIRYSDIVRPDDSIRQAIKQMEELDAAYSAMVRNIRRGAAEIEASLKGVSGATSEGRERIRGAAADAAVLESAWRDVTTAQADNARRMEEMRRSVSDYQKAAGAAAQAAERTAESVEREAKSYAELRGSVEGVRGSMDTLVREYTRAQSAVVKYRAELRALQRSDAGDDTTAARMEELNRLIIEQTQLRNRAARELNAEAKAAQAADGSLAHMRQELVMLKQAYARLSAESREGAVGKEMLAGISKANAEISKIEQAMGVYSRNVGNYASGWNGLGMSIQQVARELPSLAMGLNTFFLAISNNLPILTDEIKRAREENARMRAENQKTVPVWKQVVSSIFSWQTAMVAAITVLSMYGSDIIAWVKGLFSAEKAVGALTGEVDRFNAALVESRKSAGAEIGELRTLRARAEDVSLAMETRLAAVEKLQQKYPAYLGNLSKEEILAGNASAAYRQLTKDIMTAARARAAQERINELAGRQIQEQRGANADTNWMQRNKKAYDAAKAYMESAQGRADINQYAFLHTDAYTRAQSGVTIDPNAIERYEKYAKIIEDFEERQQRYRNHIANDKSLEKQMQSYTVYINEAAEAMNKLEESAGKAGGDVATGGGGDAVSAASGRYREELEAVRAWQDAMLENETDAWKRREQEIRYEYGRRREDLRHQLDTEAELTATEREAMNGTINELERQETAALLRLRQERELALLRLDKEMIDRALEQAREGTDEYNALQRKAVENERRQSLLQNAMEGGVRDEGAINAYWDRRMYSAEYASDMAAFNKEREAEVKRRYQSELARQRQELELRRGYLEQMRLMTGRYGSGVTGMDMTDIDTELAGVEKKMGSLGKGWDSAGGQDFWSGMLDTVFGNPFGDDAAGLEKEELFKQSISTAVDFAKSQLEELMEYRVQMAEAAVEAAARETEAARSALDAELEARANGYANSASIAQKELVEAEKNQREAEQQRQEALRQQQAVQAIEQAGNLVSATALIWKQLGFPWAIPAIAAMWASFAAARVKAAQVTKQSASLSGGASVQYGDGTVELLHGGSHQSGRDVDLGTRPDGTRRRAEGGEFFAVINKRGSRAYRSIIPDIIGSLNNGTFLERYSRAFSGLTISPVVGGGGRELSSIERDVSALRKSAGRMVYTEGGRTVYVNGNRTRKVRSV